MIAAVIGEGGSGGALGIGVADRVLILEDAYYSVISPEGCAAILWKERSAAAKAAEALKISAKDLLALGLVDEIVPEPPGGAHNDPAAAAAALKAALLRNLEDLIKLSNGDRLKQRYDKFRAYGRFTEKIEKPAMSAAVSVAAAVNRAIEESKKVPLLPPALMPFAAGRSPASATAVQL
jgi:acetyl-CoA carboxylase carboxyl transferase subunit alpha